MFIRPLAQAANSRGAVARGALRRICTFVLAIAPLGATLGQNIQTMQPVGSPPARQPVPVQSPTGQQQQSPADAGLVSRQPTDVELTAALREYPTDVVRALVTVLEEPGLLQRLGNDPQILATPDKIQPAPSAAAQNALKVLANVPDVVAVAQAHPETSAAFVAAYRRAPNQTESRAAQMRIAYRAAKLDGLIAWQAALRSDRKALEQYRDLVTKFAQQQQKQFPGFPVVAVTDDQYYLACPPNEMLINFLDDNPPPAELDGVLVRYFSEFSPESIDAKALQEPTDIARLPQVPSDLVAGQSPERRSNMWKRESTGGVGLVPIIWQPEADQPREARLASAVVEHDRLWSPVWSDPNPPAVADNMPDDQPIDEGDDVEPLQPLPPAQIAQGPVTHNNSVQPMQPIGQPNVQPKYPQQPIQQVQPDDGEIVVRQGVYGDPGNDVTYVDQQPVVQTTVDYGYGYPAGTTIINNYDYDDGWGVGAVGWGGYGWWGGGYSWCNPWYYRPVVCAPYYGSYWGGGWGGSWWGGRYGGLGFYYFDNDWYGRGWGFGRGYGWGGGFGYARPYYGYGRFYGGLWSPRYGAFSYGRPWYGRGDRFISRSGVSYRGGGFRARSSFVNSRDFASFRSRGYRGLDRSLTRSSGIRSTTSGIRGSGDRSRRIGGDFFGRDGARGLRNRDGTRENLSSPRSGFRDGGSRSIDRSGLGSLRRADGVRRSSDGGVRTRNGLGNNDALISPRNGDGGNRGNGFRDRVNNARVGDNARGGDNDGRRTITRGGGNEGQPRRLTPNNGGNNGGDNNVARGLRRSGGSDDGNSPRTINRGGGNDAFSGMRNRQGGVGSGSPSRDNRRSMVRPSGNPTGNSGLRRGGSDGTPRIRRDNTGGGGSRINRPRADASGMSPMNSSVNSSRQIGPTGSEYTVRRGGDSSFRGMTNRSGSSDMRSNGFANQAAPRSFNGSRSGGSRSGGSSSYFGNRSNGGQNMSAFRSNGGGGFSRSYGGGDSSRSFSAPRNLGGGSRAFSSNAGGGRGFSSFNGGGSSRSMGGFSGGNRSFSGGSRSFSGGGGGRSFGGFSGGGRAFGGGGGRGFRGR